jgi:hypothetical protein
MKANPGANIAALATAIRRSRTSTVTALHRLRDAGRAESLGRVWSLVEPPQPKETPGWTAPVSAQRRRVETEERSHAYSSNTGLRVLWAMRRVRVDGRVVWCGDHSATVADEFR